MKQTAVELIQNPDLYTLEALEIIANKRAIEFSEWCILWRVQVVENKANLYYYGGVKTKEYTMKKILLVLGMFTAISCSKAKVDEPIVDCNCDKVVEKTTFNVIGTPQNPGVTYHTVYTTINECSHIQKQKTFDTKDVSLIPAIGQCK